MGTGVKMLKVHLRGVILTVGARRRRGIQAVGRGRGHRQLQQQQGRGRNGD
jgi:hypothetical protein